ncbi:growth-regulated alpha protein-like [Tachysurus vachellii]|uniref:growth-regulated alpha protein-like n=1 Tax=Tachysurus vachellii TaxID=175792 RepID=UPI00296AB8FB|nr:growth-regulated alpha protein-like [Tachysurus vachellii]
MNAATLSLVFFIFFGVTAELCEGRIGGVTERCLCSKTTLQKRVKPALVQWINIFPPSASCSHTDIIITLKAGRKLCLDPNGKQGMGILSVQKQKKKTKKQRGKKQKQQQN